MPKTPRKKSIVSTWFNGVIRETLERETDVSITVKQRVKTAEYQSNRVYREPERTENQSVQSTRVYSGRSHSNLDQLHCTLSVNLNALISNYVNLVLQLT